MYELEAVVLVPPPVDEAVFFFCEGSELASWCAATTSSHQSFVDLRIFSHVIHKKKRSKSENNFVGNPLLTEELTEVVRWCKRFFRPSLEKSFPACHLPYTGVFYCRLNQLRYQDRNTKIQTFTLAVNKCNLVQQT